MSVPKTIKPDKSNKPMSKGKRLLWVLAIVSCATVALWTPLYNRTDPQLWGIPFFYWFQVLMVVLTATVTGLAYKANF